MPPRSLLPPQLGLGMFRGDPFAQPAAQVAVASFMARPQPRLSDVLRRNAIGRGTLSGDPPQPSFYVQCATRCSFPTGVGAGGFTIMSRTAHFIRGGAVSGLAVAVPNASVDGSFADTNTGGTLTTAIGIEYPLGTFTQMTFNSGSPSASFTGDKKWTDYLPIPIPDGAQFWLRQQRLCTANMALTEHTAGARLTAGLGDAVEVTTTDKTMSGTIVENAGFSIMPLAIVTYGNRVGLGWYGDSRNEGAGDTVPDMSGSQGQFARAFASQYPGLSCARGSELMPVYSKTPMRRDILRYATHILNGSGINQRSDDATTVLAPIDIDMATWIPNRDYYCATLSPWTTGAWTAADGSDQNVDGFATNTENFNNIRRAIPAGYKGCIEIADQFTMSRSIHKWLANGSPGYSTDDGGHESSVGLLRLDGLFSPGFVVSSAIANAMPQSLT